MQQFSAISDFLKRTLAGVLATDRIYSICYNQFFMFLMQSLLEFYFEVLSTTDRSSYLEVPKLTRYEFSIFSPLSLILNVNCHVMLITYYLGSPTRHTHIQVQKINYMLYRLFLYFACFSFTQQETHILLTKK